MMVPPNDLYVSIESLEIVPGWSVYRLAMLVPIEGALALRGDRPRSVLRAYINCADNGFWLCCPTATGMDIRAFRAGPL